MQLQGTLNYISPVTQNAKNYDQQYLLVTIDETTQYPQKCKVEVGKKLINTLGHLQLGQQVTIDCNLRGSAYDNKNTGLPDSFTAISAWRVTAQGTSAPAQPAATGYAPNATPPDNADSLPF